VVDARRARLRQTVRWLVAVDVMIAVVVTGMFAFGVRPWARNAFHLRGSTPPAGVSIPAFNRIPGIAPAMPNTSSLRGHAVAVIATCLRCTEGEVFGNVLERLGGDLPANVRPELIVWGGSEQAWARQWHILSAWHVHVATTRAAQLAVKQATFGGENADLLLYDTHGRWRTTYHLGMLLPQDIRHDLAGLGAGH
jgi:hypothetical protein